MKGQIMAEKDKKHSKNTMLLFPIVILRVVAGTPAAESICSEALSLNEDSK